MTSTLGNLSRSIWLAFKERFFKNVFHPIKCLFLLWFRIAGSQLSYASIISKPFLAKPKSRPPQPQNNDKTDVIIYKNELTVIKIL